MGQERQKERDAALIEGARQDKAARQAMRKWKKAGRPPCPDVTQLPKIQDQAPGNAIDLRRRELEESERIRKQLQLPEQRPQQKVVTPPSRWTTSRRKAHRPRTGRKQVLPDDEYVDNARVLALELRALMALQNFNYTAFHNIQRELNRLLPDRTSAIY